MTEHKHQKALIRARMARTGETYVVARSHVVEAVAEPGLEAEADFKAHDRHCMTAVFTPDGRHLLSGGFGGQARIWTLDGEPAGELRGHEASVNVIRVASDGSRALTASSDRTVRIWDLPARRELRVLGSHRRQVIALDLDLVHGLAWSGSADGAVAGWDIQSGERSEHIVIGDQVTSLAVRASDGVQAVATLGSGVSIRDAAGEELTRLPVDGVVASVAWATDGSFLLVSGSHDAVAWAGDRWEPVRTMGFGGAGVHPVALSPDGSRVALGWDHHLAMWAGDSQTAAVTLDGLPKGVYGLSFSPDGARLALGSADGRVRVWRVR